MTDINDRSARPWDLFNRNVGRVKPEIAEGRLSICNDCEHLIKTTKTCKECGCFMSAKVKLPNAECPVGKWQRVPISITKEIK
jgi:hypothetical protein